MSSKTKPQFDLTPILSKVIRVLEKELEKLLEKYFNDFELYEESHNSILRLPLVKKIIKSVTKENVVKSLKKENKDLRNKLEEFNRKTGENISLKIIDNVKLLDDDEPKVYEKIIPSTDEIKKEIDPSDDEEEADEAEEEEEDEEADEAGEEEEDEAAEAGEEVDEEAAEAGEEEEDEEAAEAGEEEDEEEDAEAEEEEEVETENEEDGEDEEISLFEINIGGVDYYTDDEVNGSVYEIDENKDPGKKVGYFKNKTLVLV
jgi:hypothetical protein